MYAATFWNDRTTTTSTWSTPRSSTPERVDRLDLKKLAAERDIDLDGNDISNGEDGIYGTASRDATSFGPAFAAREAYDEPHRECSGVVRAGAGNVGEREPAEPTVTARPPPAAAGEPIVSEIRPNEDAGTPPRAVGRTERAGHRAP
ncbi:hypothetical protein ACFS2C_10010 [Prauserella oleivorans]|uniref:Uncharacterized protein n=1 Tax=Prauserella oleivorans TaxID=1478153 RepID=A0ABW5W871_9PSEU